jgi:type II secretory pathway pseudopilin PulG
MSNSELLVQRRQPGALMREPKREPRDQHMKRPVPEAGFSTVELMVALAMTAVLTAIAILQLRPSMRNARSDSAMHIVVDQLRQAREYAIANRRYVAISFPVVGTEQQIAIQQMNSMTPGAGLVNPIISSIPLPDPVTFVIIGTLPDTPDGFGNGAAIDFEGVSGGPAGGMLFQSDGELLDGGTLQPINGSVFIAEPNQPTTARAVTVLGTTGRIRGWKSNGTNWFQF